VKFTFTLALFEEKNVSGQVLIVKRRRKVEEENSSSNKFLLICVLLERLNG
jgi:hypothetical protein